MKTECQSPLSPSSCAHDNHASHSVDFYYNPERGMPSDLLPKIPNNYHEHGQHQDFTKHLNQVHIVGHYRYRESLENHLGEGAYGVVYKGKDSSTGKEVAIKKVPSDKLKPDEISLMRSLRKCEHLAGLVDCCQGADSIHTYIIMELCDSDLGRHLCLRGDNGKLREYNFRVVLNSLANGYGTLFREKIVHRDIKPQNILLKYCRPDREESYLKIATAKITDFGVSRILEPPQTPKTTELAAPIDPAMRRIRSTSSLKSVAGTPYYMAPEVGANLIGDYEYDFRVDMWSIGCVLYQCLTGQPPFDESGLCRLFLKAACFSFDAYRRPELPSETPKQLCLILHSLLELDAQKRLTPPKFYCAATMYASRKMKARRQTISVSQPSIYSKSVNFQRSSSRPSVPFL